MVEIFDGSEIREDKKIGSIVANSSMEDIQVGGVVFVGVCVYVLCM